MPVVVHDVPFPDDDRPSQFATGTVELEPLDLDFETEVIARVPPATEPEPERMISTSEVASIAHDLKNPLSTIALELAVIRECLPDRLPKLLADSFQRVERNVGYLDHLIGDLLDVAAIGTSGFTLHREPTDLTSLIESLLDRAVPTRDRPRFFIDTRRRVTLDIDATRIERVVCNYVQNALKYAPAGSPIVVRVEQAHGRGIVSVVDHGPGLSAAESRLVFERFHRTATARGVAGNGLGLYISRAIVEAHGGRVGVDTEPGRGARFYFELPLHAPPSAAD